MRGTGDKYQERKNTVTWKKITIQFHVYNNGKRKTWKGKTATSDVIKQTKDKG